jgi:hypothetical protein
LLIRQTGGVLPAFVLRGRGAWRWVLFQREGGLYRTVAGEARETQERAEWGLLIKQRSLAV